MVCLPRTPNFRVFTRKAVDEDAFRQRSGDPIVVDQMVNLKKADQYLYVAVWDQPSGRLGELQIPLGTTTVSH